jgi:hypothetical protein
MITAAPDLARKLAMGPRADPHMVSMEFLISEARLGGSPTALYLPAAVSRISDLNSNRAEMPTNLDTFQEGRFRNPPQSVF